jgi:hypothetical protein
LVCVLGSVVDMTLRIKRVRIVKRAVKKLRTKRQALDYLIENNFDVLRIDAKYRVCADDDFENSYIRNDRHLIEFANRLKESRGD